MKRECELSVSTAKYPRLNNSEDLNSLNVPFFRLSISEDEIHYLLDCVNYYFTIQLKKEAINWAYSGVRSLYDDLSINASKITREYHLEVNDQDGGLPIVSIFGGKLTTYRSLADNVLSSLGPYFADMGKSWTAGSVLPGGDLKTSTFNELVLTLQKE